MKNNITRIGLFALATVFALGSCSDWDDHYDQQTITSSDEVEIFHGDVAAYLSKNADYSTIQSLFDQCHVSALTESGNFCTVLLPDNAALSAAGISTSSYDSMYVKSCIADVPVAPSVLTHYYGIYTQNGKFIWVTSETGQPVVFNDNYAVTKTIKADNGYIYLVNGVIPVRQNIREYIMGLGPDYSIFQDYIKSFETTYFNASASTQSGQVNAQGNTVYSDSVWSVRNSLMDRYDSEGVATWNMIDETYLSTVFIPNNELVTKAYQGALDSVRVWLNREPTFKGNSLYPELCDSTKFVKWIVKACFVDRRLEPEEVAPSNKGMFECVGGYTLDLNEQTDTKEYEEIDAAYWKPSVQKVDYQNPVELSNGRAFMLTDFRIPAQIVIYRMKSRFNYSPYSSNNLMEAVMDSVMNNPAWLEKNPAPYDYSAAPADKDLAYQAFFKESHLSRPRCCTEGELGVSFQDRGGTYYDDMELDPYYTVVWIPDEESMFNELPCGIETRLLMHNPSDASYGVKTARVPAGEYYLRLGLGRNLEWSVRMYYAVDDGPFQFLKEISTATNGTDYAMDRGGAMEGFELFGSGSIGLQEYYDWQYWYNQGNTKATAYDTDGGQVGIVEIGQLADGTYDGKTHTVSLKYECPDLAKCYWEDRLTAVGTKTTEDRAFLSAASGDLTVQLNDSLYYNRGAANGFQFKIYHWCLRPTVNCY